MVKQIGTIICRNSVFSFTSLIVSNVWNIHAYALSAIRVDHIYSYNCDLHRLFRFSIIDLCSCPSPPHCSTPLSSQCYSRKSLLGNSINHVLLSGGKRLMSSFSQQSTVFFLQVSLPFQNSSFRSAFISRKI